MTEHRPLPVTRALLLADQIIVESGSAKKTLVGIYTCVQAARLPARRELNLYAELIDAQGDYSFELQLVHLESDQTVAAGRIDAVHAPDRLTPLELVIRLPVTFAAYGTYEFRIEHSGQVTGSRALRVEQPLPVPPRTAPRQ